MYSSTLVPIFVCVVLPVAVVLISALTKMNSENKRTQIIIKAIESNNDVDVDKLVESFKRPQKTAREILNLRLLRGSIFSLIGLGMMAIAIFNYLSGAELESDPVAVLLVSGGASLAVGISYLVVYFVSRKQVEAESNQE